MNAQNIRLIADVDTGIDDALALIYLYRLHLAGRLDLSVTTSAGNCTAQDAARNSAEVLRVAASQWGSAAGPDPDFSGRRPVPRITTGATDPMVLPLVTTPETHGPRGLGYWLGAVGDARRAGAGEGTGDEQRVVGGTAEAAVAHWAEERPTHLLVSGPATNLAWAVRHAPEVLRGCQVAIMGGAFGYPGNTTPVAEWNAWVDPHALKYALQNWPGDAPLPVIVPLNVTEQVLLAPEVLRDWVAALDTDALNAAAPNADALSPAVPNTTTRGVESSGAAPLGELLTAALEFYFEFHEQVGVGYTAQIHDLAAAMVLLGDVDCAARECHVDVEAASELTRGATLAFDPERAFGPQRAANARVVSRLDAPGVLDRFGKMLVGN